MSTEKVYLIAVRHGDCWGGEGLDENGRAQIHETAKALKKLGIEPDAIITSTTARTRQSTEILSEYFNQIASKQEKYLFFEKAKSRNELIETLSLVPTESKNVILSGHAETVNFLTYHELNDNESKKLLGMIEKKNLEEYISGEKDIIITTARTGDAIVLEGEKETSTPISNVKWSLHSYVKNGELLLASDYEVPENFIGKKNKREKNFPVIAFQR